MKRIFGIFAVLSLFMAWAGIAQAQVGPGGGAAYTYCYSGSGAPTDPRNWAGCTTGGSGGTASSFGAAFPATGTAIGMSQGGNMVAFNGLAGNLLVNCAVGCSGGTFNNNADNVATSATNGQAAAWLYVWDGSAWDRLYGDSTNGAKVQVTNTNANGQAVAGSSSPVVVAKNSGTGSTIAGAAVGTAGSPSAEYVSVQGPVTGIPVSPGTLAGGATFVSGTTAAMTGTTSTQIIALVSAQRIYVTRIKCNNTSSTATLVQIRDGSAGTVLDTLAAGATYGGEQGTGPTPLFWTTAGTALYAQNVTTGASVICTASGYSG